MESKEWRDKRFHLGCLQKGNQKESERFPDMSNIVKNDK